MPLKDGSASRGEMRRRHEEIIRSGVLRRVRSEGRLVFALALCWADYKTCQFRMSVRGAATTAGVEPTTVRRGLSQLLDLGVIEAGPTEPGKRQRYRFRTPQKSAHEPCPGGARVVPGGAHEPCPGARTSGAQSAHEPCAGRAHPVSGARTGCAPYSSIVLKGSSRTREDTSVLTGRTGPDGPAGRMAESDPVNSDAASMAAKLRAEAGA
jgi:hypothetical protein